MKEIILAKVFFNFTNLIIIFLLTALFQKAQASTECPGALTPPHLVIGIDGVSYDTFNKSRASGHFAYLNSVVPMISSFPSTSGSQLEPYVRRRSYRKLHYGTL